MFRAFLLLRFQLTFLNNPEDERISVVFTGVGPDGGDDKQDQPAESDDGPEDEADEDEAENTGDDRINQKADVEVDGFSALAIDEWETILLQSPEDDGADNAANDGESGGDGRQVAEHGEGASFGIQLDGARPVRRIRDWRDGRDRVL